MWLPTDPVVVGELIRREMAREMGEAFIKAWVLDEVCSLLYP